MIRFLDFSLSLIGLIILMPLMVFIYLICLTDTGSPIFKQCRVGKNKNPFNLIKFRTMSLDTKSVASHSVNYSSVTKLGSILRKTKIDELPQLWNVLKGEMSLVGPRPNLFNQNELIRERDTLKVYNVRPGITGLAQIQKIDMSQPRKLAETDSLMIKSMSFKKYLYYISKTLLGSGSGDAVKGK